MQFTSPPLSFLLDFFIQFRANPQPRFLFFFFLTHWWALNEFLFASCLYFEGGRLKMWSRNWTRIANSRSRIRPSSALCSSIRRFLSTFPGKRFAAVWGNGDYGRLGHGNLESHARPMPVASPAFEKEGLKSIACGGAHTLFLTGWFRFLHLTPFSPCSSDLRFPMGNLHLTVS